MRCHASAVGLNSNRLLAGFSRSGYPRRCFKNCVHHAYSASRATHALARSDKQLNGALIAISFRLISPVPLFSRQLQDTGARAVVHSSKTLYNTLHSLRTAPSVFDCTLQMINGRMRAEVLKIGLTVGVRRVASGIICYQACPARTSFSLKLPKRR